MIRSTDVVRDAVELIQLDTQNPGPGETACADWLLRRLYDFRGTVEQQPVIDGRTNIIARVPGRDAAPRLVLLAHMDTVPVGEGWSVPPLAGEIRDGKLYGRGSCDMKAGLAIAVNLIEALAQQDHPPAGDVLLCATVDEEGGAMLGAHELVRQGSVTASDQILALEPTGLRLRIAQVGVRWMTVTVQGKMAHAGRAHLGIDANHVMARLVDRVKARVEELPYTHPILGRSQITCGRIQGGVGTNVVPPSCVADFDFRLVPPITPESAAKLVEDAARSVEGDFEGAVCTAEGLGVGRPPVHASESAKVVQDLRRAFHRVTSRDLDSGGSDGHEAYTDASMIAALTGSASCTVFGPGSSDQAHTADEFVPLDDIAMTSHVLWELVRSW